MENVISMFQCWIDDSFTVGTFSPWTSQHLWTENVGEGWSVSWDKSYNCRTRHTCECLGNDQKSREQEIAHPFKPRRSPIIQNLNPTTRFKKNQKLSYITAFTQTWFWRIFFSTTFSARFFFVVKARQMLYNVSTSHHCWSWWWGCDEGERIHW